MTVRHGQLRFDFNPISVALGLVVLPAGLLAWQWLRGRRAPTRFEATGPLAPTVNMVIFFALVLTPWYAPPLSSDRLHLQLTAQAIASFHSRICQRLTTPSRTNGSSFTKASAAWRVVNMPIEPSS